MRAMVVVAAPAAAAAEADTLGHGLAFPRYSFT